MGAEFYDASEELEVLARKLIQDYHGHLVEAKIKYLFRTGNWEVKKRETWGQAKRVSKETNFLTGYDFIITVHMDVWEQLNAEEKEALLDHELQHCSAGSDDSGNKVWYIQGHDVEDFYAIIRRHGLWSKALKKMENVLNQTELEFESDSEPEEELLGIAGRERKELTGSQPLRALPSPEPDPEEPAEESDIDPDDDDIIDIEPIDIEVVRDTGTEG